MIHSNIIIQKLDILAEFNAINDGQLYILRGQKLYFRKKCILSLTIDLVLANSVDSEPNAASESALFAKIRI